MHDFLSDFLIRIKNGYLARKKEIVVPYSKFCYELALVFLKLGFLEEVKKEKDKKSGFENINIVLKYEKKKPALTDIKQISKPGLRVYKNKNEILKIKERLGIFIISTSKGIKTNDEVKKLSLGGEIICKIW